MLEYLSLILYPLTSTDHLQLPRQQYNLDPFPIHAQDFAVRLGRKRALQSRYSNQRSAAGRNLRLGCLGAFQKMPDHGEHAPPAHLPRDAQIK